MSRHSGREYRISSLSLIPLILQGVRSPVVGSDVHTKSNLDNIVGSLWQARQESSGSSVGAQVIITTVSILPCWEPPVIWSTNSRHLNNILHHNNTSHWNSRQSYREIFSISLTLSLLGRNDESHGTVRLLPLLLIGCKSELTGESGLSIWSPRHNNQHSSQRHEDLNPGVILVLVPPHQPSCCKVVNHESKFGVKQYKIENICSGGGGSNLHPPVETPAAVS